jgi:dsDNA-specific endonuclease/ATPase MutS2
MSILGRIKNFFAGRNSEPHSTDPEWMTDDNLDPFNPFPEPVTIEITDVIDLHTIQPKDVQRVVEEYLEQVHQAGFRSVRIIHGKGIGVQREIVRTVLARTSFVDTWTDAPPDAGGLGATIVQLGNAPD